MRKKKSSSLRWMLFALFVVIGIFGLLEWFGSEKSPTKNKQTLIERDTSGVFEVDFYKGKEFFRITKDLDEQWKINDSIPMDQNLAKEYIGQFEKIESYNYQTTFDTTSIERGEISRLLIKSADEPTEIQLTCYEVGHRNYKYLIHSSQFPEYYFWSDEDGLCKDLFWERGWFE